MPSNTITTTSLSWHPIETVVACTLSSGALLITRIGERSDGEKFDRPTQRGSSGDLVISNGYHDEYDEEEEYEEEEEEDNTRQYDLSFEDSFVSRHGEEMIVDEEEDSK